MADRRSRHGLGMVKAKVMLLGLASVDRRTAAAQSLIAWKSELLRDLGGIENISAQRMALIEMATRTRLVVDHVDHWILAQHSLINKRKKALLPVLQQRQALVDSLARLLNQIGLDRQEKPVPSLAEYLASKEREMALQDAPGGDPSDVAGEGRADALPEGQDGPGEATQ